MIDVLIFNFMTESQQISSYLCLKSYKNMLLINSWQVCHSVTLSQVFFGVQTHVDRCVFNMVPK